MFTPKVYDDHILEQNNVTNRHMETYYFANNNMHCI